MKELKERIEWLVNRIASREEIITELKADLRTLYLNSRSNYISPIEKEKVKSIVSKYGLKA